MIHLVPKLSIQNLCGHYKIKKLGVGKLKYLSYMSKYILHDAVQRCELADVRLAISKGLNLDELDDFGNSPLHWAVLGGYEDIVMALLESGANPNVISDDGITPKWSAADFGLTRIEQLLTKFGGKITTNDKFDKTSWSVFKSVLGQTLPKEED